MTKKEKQNGKTEDTKRIKKKQQGQLREPISRSEIAKEDKF